MQVEISSPMANALEQYKQQWVFSNEPKRQRLPRQRSQVLNHLIRRREIGCDSESMDRYSLQEKDGARKKNKSPEFCGDTTRKKVAKLFISSEVVTKSTCARNLLSQEVGNVPLLTVYCVCVPRGGVVKDDPGSHVVFTEQGSPTSHMTAAKVLDVPDFQDAFFFQKTSRTNLLPVPRR